jgi:hypothetical protein
MKEMSWDNINKSGWPDGPWKFEKDKIQFEDEATGLPCLIVRNPGGALCGYVGITEGHPLFGRDYNEPDFPTLDVHGGLTFSDFCADSEDETRHICHLPEPGEPHRVYWLGFDCNHWDDYMPAYEKLSAILDGEYRNVAYVQAECAKLAEGLIHLQWGLAQQIKELA